MRLLRFVAVAVMVTVGVASIGCAPEASTAPAESNSSTPAEGTEDADEAGSDAAAGTTEVSLNVTGMA